MKVIDRLPFEPWGPNPPVLDVEIAIARADIEQAPFVSAKAYIDPGADVFCLRDTWVANAAEPGWGQRLSTLDNGVVTADTSFIIKIQAWQGNFEGDAQVVRSLATTSDVTKHFKTHDRFEPASGHDEVLLGASFLRPFVLVFVDGCMTLLDPRVDEVNEAEANSIRAVIGLAPELEL